MDLPEELVLFGNWLEDHAQGAANHEITADLASVVEMVRQVGKPGEVVIKVRVEPAGGHGRQVKTAVMSVAKLPKFDPEESIFYAGPGGSLHRDDPYEPKLVGIEVPDADGNPVNINPTTGAFINEKD